MERDMSKDLNTILPTVDAEMANAVYNGAVALFAAKVGEAKGIALHATAAGVLASVFGSYYAPANAKHKMADIREELRAACQENGAKQAWSYKIADVAVRVASRMWTGKGAEDVGTRDTLAAMLKLDTQQAAIDHLVTAWAANGITTFSHLANTVAPKSAETAPKPFVDTIIKRIEKAVTDQELRGDDVNKLATALANCGEAFVSAMSQAVNEYQKRRKAEEMRLEREKAKAQNNAKGRAAEAA